MRSSTSQSVSVPQNVLQFNFRLILINLVTRTLRTGSVGEAVAQLDHHPSVFNGSQLFCNARLMQY